MIILSIMGDFSWRPLGKQDRISSGTVPPSAIDPPIREGGQPAARADPNDDEVVKVSPNVPSSIFAKMKCDDDTRVSSRKKLRPSLNLQAMK